MDESLRRWKDFHILPFTASLFSRVVALIEGARQRVAQAANIAQVYTNYEIGRQIVEEEQGGKRRAGYGEQVLMELSSQLTIRFGRGFPVDNLQNMRTFYLVYSAIDISETPSRKSSVGKYETLSRKFTLGWFHYVLLMRIADPVERTFYEREAAERNWSFRQLERMYRTSTFERLQISKDKAKVRALMTRPAPRHGADIARTLECIPRLAHRNRPLRPFPCSAPCGPFGVRASRSGNLTPSAQANITILPLRPPAIHRTPLATLLRNAHCVRGICTRRRTNALPSHSGRNRRDIERVHTVTFYVLFACYLR